MNVERVVALNLEGQILDAGYASITDFVRQSKIPVSFETVRRAARKGDVGVYSLLLIFKHLGYTKSEIKKRLTEIGDDTIAPLLSDGIVLEKEEESLITVYRRLRGSFNDFPLVLASILDAVSRASGSNAKEFSLAVKKGRS